MATVSLVIKGAEVLPRITIATYETILELKRAIEARIGIPVARQTLKFSGRVLNDSTNIDHYGFEESASLYLIVEPLASNVKLNISVSAAAVGQLKLEVKESDTVLTLKKKIEQIWDVEASDMALYHLGENMRNDQPLSQYYIHEGSDVHLRTPMLC